MSVISANISDKTAKMASRKSLTRGHYFQGGYDYEFVENIDSKHECPICLLCQRDPHQTSCGHRFCHSCILTWLNEGKTCPHDNCSLGEGMTYLLTTGCSKILVIF